LIDVKTVIAQPCFMQQVGHWYAVLDALVGKPRGPVHDSAGNGSFQQFRQRLKGRSRRMNYKPCGLVIGIGRAVSITQSCLAESRCEGVDERSVGQHPGCGGFPA